jgi:hypothetical protein
VGTETRARCFLHCGKETETGDRARASQAADPLKKWHCHQYGCGKGGNLVSLCDLLKPGPSAGGRPRGERFKEIATDLQAMVAGTLSGGAPHPPAAPLPAPRPEAKVMGLCSNTITREQATKAATLARTVGGGVVTVLLDLDPEGENGMRQCLGYLAQLVPVRLAWSPKMFGGKYRGRQPESLTVPEWQAIDAFLRSGKEEGWSLA